MKWRLNLSYKRVKLANRKLDDKSNKIMMLRTALLIQHLLLNDIECISGDFKNIEIELEINNIENELWSSSSKNIDFQSIIALNVLVCKILYKDIFSFYFLNFENHIDTIGKTDWRDEKHHRCI